jgi:hypothetical protein
MWSTPLTAGGVRRADGQGIVRAAGYQTPVKTRILAGRVCSPNSRLCVRVLTSYKSDTVVRLRNDHRPPTTDHRPNLCDGVLQ